MNECYCICHVNPEQVFHCGPCCWQCQYCLGNIIDTPEDHYKECWAAKETKMEICDKLESVWKPACEHCHNCECHKPPEGPCPYVKCYCCGETIPSIESSVVSIVINNSKQNYWQNALCIPCITELENYLETKRET
jgi:hypothetical protein